MASQHLRVLVAEDEKTASHATQKLLSSMGHESEVVCDGIEVLLALKRRTFDLILMDLQMPVMDGLQATSRVRQLFGSTKPIIFAVTANYGKGFQKACESAGMQGFLTKPIESSKIQELIEDWFPE